MTTSAADENPSKRRRVEHDTLSRDAVSLDNVNDHCLIEILRFLEADDLNSFAICSQRCREARSSPSLDQTRTGTIICSPGWSILGIYNAISRGGWNNELYSGNRTRLRVVGLQRFAGINWTQDEFIRQRALSDDVQLAGVTSLDLSCSHDDWGGRDERDPYLSVYYLPLILPNLRVLDVSYIPGCSHLIRHFCTCSHLTRLTWNGAGVFLLPCPLHGSVIHTLNLTELYIDGAQLKSRDLVEQRLYEEDLTSGGNNYYIFKFFGKRLERVSIKNVTWENFEFTEQPISQGMIMKFIRHTPSLRWLRSHLTVENVAMMQQERPDITFVVD